MPLRSFDRIARAYLWLERLTFGRSLHRTRTHFLPALLAARHALVLGDGDGRFLADLLSRNPHLQALAIDSSPGMLHQLRHRCAFATGRLETRRADALFALRIAPPTPQFDLVCTHFFLDCLSEHELRTLVQRLLPHLRPGALWVLSDFRIPPRGPSRLLAQLVVQALYVGFRLLTGLRNQRLPAHAPILHHLGFRLQARSLSLGGLLTAELWAAPCIQPRSHTTELPQMNQPAEDSPLSDERAPIETAYDIDPLTPLPHAPNPLPTEVERDLIRQHQSPPEPHKPE